MQVHGTSVDTRRYRIDKPFEKSENSSNMIGSFPSLTNHQTKALSTESRFDKSCETPASFESIPLLGTGVLVFQEARCITDE
jgi:hypothetical protein